MKFCESGNRVNFENLRIIRLTRKEKRKKCEDRLHYLNNNINFKAFIILCKIEQIFKITLFSGKIFS